MKQIAFFLLFAFIVLSCAPATRYELFDDPQMSFEGWENKIKLNTGLIDSRAHDAYVDIYVNELAKEAYEKRLSEFPVGAEVYKPLYGDMQRERLARLVIMIKMPKGYDTQNGDWWYGVYDKTGTEAWHRGRIQSCIDCHAMAKKTDYMFSESVMHEIELHKEF